MGPKKRSPALTGVVTSTDVAREAGVGVGTVSRVVNGTAGVSISTREKVNRAIERLGFRPNPIAQSMRNGQTKTLGYVTRDFSVSVLSLITNSIQDVVDPKGFSLQVASSFHDVDREIEILKKFVLRRIDGVILPTTSEDDQKLIRFISSLPIPIVLLDRSKPEEIDAVMVDHRYGVRTSVLHLLDLGHTNIALIGGQPNVRPTTERIAGFRDAFSMRGLPVPEANIRMGSFSTEYAYNEVASLLSRKNRPTALFSGGTAMLAGVLRAIRDAGLQIPRDISVVSGVDSELALLHVPGITSVRWDLAQLGSTAARFLLHRLEEPNCAPQRMIFPTELVQRDSCGPAVVI